VGDRLGESVDLSIVIPAYNEERRLPHTLESVNEYLQKQSYTYEVIIVDDGSADRTSQIVEDFQKSQPRLKLITLDKNKGKGFAVRTGILHSRGRIVIFTDADLSVPIKEVEKLQPLLEEGYDIVIGSRKHPDSKIIRRESRLRCFMGRIYHRLNRWLGIKDVQDVPCGFKGFRREAAKQLFLAVRLNRFSFDAEVLYLTQRKYNLRWKQIPIEWTHSCGSKVHILRDPAAMILDLIKIKLYDLRGLYK
jgi:dolichyl-phosphate beta-glucosyltransferase